MKKEALCWGSQSAAGLTKGHYLDLADAGLSTISESGDQDSAGFPEEVPVTLARRKCHPWNSHLLFTETCRHRNLRHRTKSQLSMQSIWHRGDQKALSNVRLLSPRIKDGASEDQILRDSLGRNALISATLLK